MSNPTPSFNTVEDAIDFIDTLTAQDEADDEAAELKPFLRYVGVARDEWTATEDGKKFYESEKPRFRRLIEQKLLAEFPNEADRAIMTTLAKTRFPELFED